MHFVLVVFCVVLGSTFVESLYEDQVGRFDWHLENIGAVKHAIFHPDSKTKKIFVASESNVIAAINQRKGEIMWRQILPNQETVDALHFNGKYLISVSENCKQIRAWNPANGGLVFNKVIAANNYKSGESCEVLASKDGDANDVVVLAGRSVYHNSWTWLSQKQDISASSIVKKSNGNIGFFGLSKGEVYHTELSPSSGSAVSSQQKSEGCSHGIILKVGGVVCLDADGTLKLWSGAGSVKTSKIKELLSTLGDLRASGPFKLVSVALDDTFLVEVSSGQTAVVSVKKDLSGFEPVHLFHGSQFQKFAASERDGEKLVFGVQIGDATTEISVVNVNTKTLLTPQNVRLKADEEGHVLRVWSEVFTKKDRSDGHRLLILTQGHSLVMVKDGSVAWQREEALASIVDVAFVDLPPRSRFYYDDVSGDDYSNTAHRSVISQFLYRVQKHATEVREMFDSSHKGVSVPVGSAAEGVPDDPEMIGDRFGFNKLLVIMTSQAKMFGVLTQSGRMVWKRLFSHLPSASSSPPLLRRFFVTRTSMHYQLECVVLGQLSSSPNAPSFVAWMNPLTGSVTGMQSLPYRIIQTMLLPYVDAEHRHLLMTIDSNLHIHLFPDTDAAHKLFSANAAGVFFYLVDQQEGSIKGYSVAASLSADEADPRYEYAANLIWSVVFAKDEKIASLAARVPETVKSTGRVLMDRSVLHKYLNPNLLIAATSSPASALVRLYLIDTVTGSILFSTHHTEADGPINVIQSENLILYAFRNVAKCRTEVSALELYENVPADWFSTTLAGYIFGNHSTPKFSSRSSGAPSVATTSFILPATIKTIATTTTELGITTKQFLLGLESDQVFVLDRRLVDPRRPMQPVTAEEREEGIFQYSPILPLQPTGYLSYNQSIPNLHSIKTAAARLESTSLVVAWGLDVFFTRIAPAKTFDTLQDDFNKGYLLLATALLGAATGLTWVLYHRKELHAAWK